MNYATQDYPLDRLVVGFIFSVIGPVFVVFCKSIKQWRDNWNSKDFPVGYGEMWTGKYTKGGLIFTYAVIIVTGAIFLIIGIGFIVSAVRG